MSLKAGRVIREVVWPVDQLLRAVAAGNDSTSRVDEVEIKVAVAARPRVEIPRVAADGVPRAYPDIERGPGDGVGA